MNDADGLIRFTVDLDAIARNYLFFVKKAKRGADVAAVVKADAYGLGAAEVSAALYAQGCRHFFTADVAEAARLRAVALAAGDAQIYVLDGPCGHAPRDLAAAGITPVLNSLDDVQGFAAQSGDARYPAVIHLDTGMNRLGLGAGEDPSPYLDAIDLRYVMSHLVSADQPDDPLNGVQLARFQQRAAALGRPLRLSLANSAGALLGEAYHFDLLRPGCGLYGINPIPSQPSPVLPVVEMQARILQIRELREAATVGYNAAFSVKPPAILATVSVGYADGCLRSQFGRGTVVIDGLPCPVRGRVSMDSIVAEVTHLPRRPRAGDWVTIIGAGRDVDQAAAEAGTIGYEILTAAGNGRRMRRAYKGATT